MDRRITVYLLSPTDRPNYRGEWIEPGTSVRRSRSLKTADPDQAETRRADLEYELNHDLARRFDKITWHDFRQRCRHRG